MKTWFKFYGQEFLSDPKMLSLTAIEKGLWLTMLCLASSSEEEGVIKYIDESKIMTLAGIDRIDDEWTENEGFLKKFEGLNMINVTENKITLRNFKKRQEANLTTAERQERYRAKHPKVTEVTEESNTKVTKPVTKVTLEKNRIEKNRKEINISGDSRPEISSKSPLGDVLNKKGFVAEQKRGVYTEWQDKAFRYADALKIKLDGDLTSRWLKVFKQAHEGRNQANLERAFTYLQDHPNVMGNDERARFFFSIYENGLRKQAEMLS